MYLNRVNTNLLLSAALLKRIKSTAYALLSGSVFWQHKRLAAVVAIEPLVAIYCATKHHCSSKCQSYCLWAIQRIPALASASIVYLCCLSAELCAQYTKVLCQALSITG